MLLCNRQQSPANQEYGDTHHVAEPPKGRSGSEGGEVEVFRLEAGLLGLLEKCFQFVARPKTLSSLEKKEIGRVTFLEPTQEVRNEQKPQQPCGSLI